MVGRGLVSLLGAAIVLGISAPAALSDEGQRLIMVEHSPFMIEQLEKQRLRRRLHRREVRGGRLRRRRRRGEAARRRATRSARSIEDDNTWHARKAEIAATTEREALASEFAQKGIPTSGVKRNGKHDRDGAGPGRDHARLHVHELRRAASSTSRRTTRRTPTPPARRCRCRTPVPTACSALVISMSNTQHQPRRRRRAAIGGNKIADGDAASNRYMYHRSLRRRCAAPTRT